MSLNMQVALRLMAARELLLFYAPRVTAEC